MQDQLSPATGARPAGSAALFEAIRETAMRQRAAIEKDDLASFHTLLTQREALIAKAAQISDAERAAAADVLRDILTVDEENQRLLSAKIEEAQRELNAVRGGRQALRSYAPLAPQREARFVDRLG